MTLKEKTRKLKKVILNVREASEKQLLAYDTDPKQKYCKLTHNHGEIKIQKINGVRISMEFMEPCQAYFEALAIMARKNDIVNIVLNSDDNRVAAFAHRLKV